MNDMRDAWPHADGPVVTTKTEYLEERGKRKPKRAVISMEEAIRTAEIGKVMYVQTGRGVVRMCIEKALAPGEVHDYVCERFGVVKAKAARKVLRAASRSSAVTDRSDQVRERALSFDEAVLVAKPGMRLLLDFGRGPFYYTFEGKVRPEGRRALLDRLLEMEFERPAWAPQHSKTF